MAGGFRQIYREYLESDRITSNQMDRWKSLLDNSERMALYELIISDKAMETPSKKHKLYEDGLINSVLCQYFTAVKEIEQKVKEIEQKVTTDELTGLANRRGFEKGLERCLSRADREQYSETSKCVALLSIDVNGFKAEANDKYGHAFGDEVLKYVAEGLKRSTRATDLVARVGGDEFAVVVDPLHVGEAESFLNRFCDDVNSYIRIAIIACRDKFADITISAGMSVYGKDAKNIKDLKSNADKAMYSAKRRFKESGDINCHLYNPDQFYIGERMEGGEYSFHFNTADTRDNLRCNLQIDALSVSKTNK